MFCCYCNTLTVENAIPTMKELNRFVVRKYATDWYEVGIELELQHKTLQAISKENHQQNEFCFRSMLDKWLELNPNATWRTLEIALTNVKRLKLDLDPIDGKFFVLLNRMGMHLCSNKRCFSCHTLKEETFLAVSLLIACTT